MLKYFLLHFSFQQRWQFLNVALTVCVPFLHYWKSGVNSIEVTVLPSGVNVLSKEEKTPQNLSWSRLMNIQKTQLINMLLT